MGTARLPVSCPSDCRKLSLRLVLECFTPRTAGCRATTRVRQRALRRSGQWAGAGSPALLVCTATASCFVQWRANTATKYGFYNLGAKSTYFVTFYYVSNKTTCLPTTMMSGVAPSVLCWAREDMATRAREKHITSIANTKLSASARANNQSIATVAQYARL